MEKYQKYKFPISNETMDEIYNKKTEYELLTHQKFLGEYLFDKQNINGLLIFHTMGSGRVDLITKLEHEESLSTNINYSSNNSIRATNESSIELLDYLNSV